MPPDRKGALVGAAPSSRPNSRPRSKGRSQKAVNRQPTPPGCSRSIRPPSRDCWLGLTPNSVQLLGGLAPGSTVFGHVYECGPSGGSFQGIRVRGALGIAEVNNRVLSFTPEY